MLRLALAALLALLLAAPAHAQVHSTNGCPFASVSQLGCVKGDGSTVSISATGVLSTLGAPPTGTAGGVLSGTYPNPGLAASIAGSPTATGNWNFTGTVSVGNGSLSVGGNAMTFPAGPDTLGGLGTIETWTATQTFNSGKLVATSPSFTTPILGAATATTINKWAFTAPTTAATLTAGADNQTYTLPAASDTIVGRASTDTLTSKTIAFGSNTLTGVAPLASPTFTGTVTFPDSSTHTSTGLNGVGMLGVGVTAVSGELAEFHTATNRNWGVRDNGNGPDFEAINDARAAYVQALVDANPLVINSVSGGGVQIAGTGLAASSINLATHEAAFTVTTSVALTTQAGLDQTFTAAGKYSCNGHFHFTTAPTTSNGFQIALASDGTSSITTLNFTAIGFNGAAFATSGTGTATALGSAAINSLNAFSDVLLSSEIVVNVGGVIHVQIAENTSSGTIAGNARWDCHRAA